MNNDDLNTDRQNDDFEGFLRQFHLRVPRPLHEAKASHEIRPRMWKWAWAAGVVVAIAVVIVALLSAGKKTALPQSEPIAVMQSNGERIESGTVVRSGDDVNEVLALVDSSSIEMKSRSELSLDRIPDGVLVRLVRGSVIVSAAEQRTGHLYVETRDLRVSVVGTVFLVDSVDDGSRVFVIHGEVQVRQGGAIKNLLPGEQLTSVSTMQPIAVTEQIAWSRNAAAHLALLQQVAAFSSNSVRSPVAQPPVASVRPSPAVGLAFEVATIKPESQPGRSFLLCQGKDLSWGPNAATFPVPRGRCQGNNVSLADLISGAYRVPLQNITGGPSWVYARGVAYAVEAKAEDTSSTTTQQLREMLQSLLADRFQLLVHTETTEVDGYVLLAGKKTARLKAASGNQHGVHMNNPRPGRLAYEVADGSTPYLAELLSGFLRLPVLDKTGLTGTYDYTLTIDRIGGGKKEPPAGVSVETEFEPPIPIAVEDQLGLRMERQRVPVETLVIDRAEKPSDNESDQAPKGKK